MGLRPADAARLGIDHAPTVPAEVRAAIEERGVRELAAAMTPQGERCDPGPTRGKGRGAGRRRGPRRAEREQAAQEEVVRALRAGGVLFCAVPNGGARSEREGAALQRAGVQAGFPDLLIFDPPTVAPPDRCPICWRPNGWTSVHGGEEHEGCECADCAVACWGCAGDADGGLRGAVGVALEMKAAGLRPKTSRAGRWSGARPEQRRRLAALEERGWVAIVAYGADDALRQLREMGYEV